MSSDSLTEQLNLIAIGNLSYIYISLKKYKKSLNLLSNTLSSKQLPSQFKLGFLINLSAGFSSIQNYSVSLKYSLKALQLSSKVPNPEIQSLILYNIGTCYFHSENIPKALEYLKSSISQSPKPEPNPSFSAMVQEALWHCSGLHHPKATHTRASSLNSIKLSNLMISKLNLTSRILSDSYRKSKTKIPNNDSIKSDSSCVFNEQACSLNDVKKRNEEFSALKQVRRIRNDIAKCFEDVKGFCGKMKESLSMVYLDKWKDYLTNLDKIEKIQRFYRNRIKKTRELPGKVVGQEVGDREVPGMKSDWLARNRIVKNRDFGKLVRKRFLNH